MISWSKLPCPRIWKHLRQRFRWAKNHIINWHCKLGSHENKCISLGCQLAHCPFSFVFSYIISAIFPQLPFYHPSSQKLITLLTLYSPCFMICHPFA